MLFKIEIKIINGAEFSINEFRLRNNKINFLFGESGIGKTLICKALLGLLSEEEYIVSIDDEPYSDYLKLPGVKDMLSKSFYAFQEPSRHLSPVLTIGEQLSEGSLKENNEKDDILSGLFPEIKKKELESLLNLYPKPFRPSGGEKQRFIDAMGIIKIGNLYVGTAWNGLFVFDEPTGHLDQKKRDVFINQLLLYYVKDRPTIIFITHDYSILSMLEEKFSLLKKQFVYHEIFQNRDKLEQREFSESDYFAWIAKEKKIKKPPLGSAIVLKVSSGIGVFGNILRFYRDKNHKKETELILRKGEIVYLKAPSGVGKTTVAKILSGLVKAKFSYEISGIKINNETPYSFIAENIWGKKITMAFQHADECLNQNATVLRTFQAITKDKNKFIPQILELFPNSNIEELFEKKIKQLSGGEKQKINLLRSLLVNADITILDEPINGMDLTGISKIVSYIRKKLNEGKTFLLISHSEDIFSTIVRQKNIYYLKREPDNNLSKI
jgi:ABC-type glutathione transport system ATPase component